MLASRTLLRAALVACIAGAVACRAIVGFDEYSSSDAQAPTDASRDDVATPPTDGNPADRDSAPVDGGESAHVVFDVGSNYDVPDGCAFVHAKLWGAGGGSALDGGPGGAGGFATAAWRLDPTAPVTVLVGKAGTDVGGDPGGGTPTNATLGHGGGGYSAVLNGDIKVYAGAGGGGCLFSSGGAGGGAYGETGGAFLDAGGGEGGGPDRGGAGGFGPITGSAGGKESGGESFNNGAITPGAGGGGYYGGGGGSSDFGSACGGGGGGSAIVKGQFTESALEGGTGILPGNRIDTERDTAGDPDHAGRVVLWCSLKP